MSWILWLSSSTSFLPCSRMILVASRSFEGKFLLFSSTDTTIILRPLLWEFLRPSLFQCRVLSTFSHLFLAQSEFSVQPELSLPSSGSFLEKIKVQMWKSMFIGNKNHLCILKIWFSGSHAMIPSIIHVLLEAMVQEILSGNCSLLSIMWAPGLPYEAHFTSLNALCPSGLCWAAK